MSREIGSGWVGLGWITTSLAPRTNSTVPSSTLCVCAGKLSSYVDNIPPNGILYVLPARFIFTHAEPLDGDMYTIGWNVRTDEEGFPVHTDRLTCRIVPGDEVVRLTEDWIDEFAVDMAVEGIRLLKWFGGQEGGACQEP